MRNEIFFLNCNNNIKKKCNSRYRLKLNDLNFKSLTLNYKVKNFCNKNPN